jgi:hypothetical protein
VKWFVQREFKFGTQVMTKPEENTLFFLHFSTNLRKGKTKFDEFSLGY